MMERLILIVLVTVPGVWGGNWKVTLKNQCALKGTSVVIKCEYDYPFGHIVTSVGWSKGWSPLSTSDRFKYVGNYRGDCSLQANDVQLSDEGAYFFSFVTTLNSWTSKTYSYLFVKELTTVVEPSTVTEGDNVRLTCLSGCPGPMYVDWFRDGQPVQQSPDFQARREDAGRYYCALRGQETVRSASVALNVQYAPKKVTLSVTPLGGIVRGSTVTFTCSSDANPPVTQSGYSLYKEGHFIRSGQKHTISDIQPGHSGEYYCQAWNNISWRGIDLIHSTEVHLDVQYGPMNISISMDSQHVAEGSSVNLTCSSAANPATDNYTWYKRTASQSSISMLQVGSGQVLSIPSMEASHTGLYLCQARNSLGENSSTAVLLAVKEKQSQPLPMLAGVGVSLFVTLVIALLLLWKKQRTSADKKQSDFRLSGRGSRSSATEDPSDSVYANIHTFPSSPPPVSAQPFTPASHHDANTSYEDEVIYTTVTIKPRNPNLPRHNSRAPQDSWSKRGDNDSSVIYATVVKSS